MKRRVIEPAPAPHLLTRRNFAAGSLLVAGAPAIIRARPARAAPTPAFFSASFGAGEPFVATPKGIAANGARTWKSTEGADAEHYFLNDEQEYYQDSLGGFNPFSVRDGVLTITASAQPAASNPAGHRYTSGVINTCRLPGGVFTGARLDVRAKLPRGAGLWPAIWLLPVNNQWPPEIDVMEMLGEDPSTIYCSLHWGPDTDDADQYKHTERVRVADTSAGFHNYGVDFDSADADRRVTFYFDNRLVYAHRLPPRLAGLTWYLMINLGIGGPRSWGGKPTAATVFPASMQVDYVRMFPPGTVLPPG